MRYLVAESQKLVQFLQLQIDPPTSGKVIRRILEARLCRVNGVVERFGSAMVGKGSVVELSPAWSSLLSMQPSKFQTLYEDEYLAVVDKPSGWVCTDDDCRKQFGPNRFLVHRLDKETTGVLLIAKSVSSREAMVQKFQERSVEKLYFALVDGIPSDGLGICKSHFAKIGTFEGQTLWGSRAKGLLAETHWKVIDRGQTASLLACQPITGRTHQIRVHLAEMGHPILIDRQYAKRYRSKLFATRPLLHASRIRFQHPITSREIDVSAPLPSDFLSALSELKLG